VHRVDVRIVQYTVNAGVANIDMKRITDGIELLFISLTDGIYIRLRVFLADRDELRPEAKSDESDIH
jgi:hypothetical protein|tara:strand:+ start:949 stop:1149 length:201 start_codon:yes stop_codon:yes gene_type:complete